MSPGFLEDLELLRASQAAQNSRERTSKALGRVLGATALLVWASVAIIYTVLT